MTRRFFYTDQLAAAWMAKHFRMEFIGPNGNLVWVCIDFEQQWFSEAGNDGSETQKAYIHPDSLHLFEPKTDDVVLMNDMDGANSLEFWWEGRNKGKPIRIIEREGYAFHWPQSEESEEA